MLHRVLQLSEITQIVYLFIVILRNFLGQGYIILGNTTNGEKNFPQYDYFPRFQGDSYFFNEAVYLFILLHRIKSKFNDFNNHDCCRHLVLKHLQLTAIKIITNEVVNYFNY